MSSLGLIKAKLFFKVGELLFLYFLYFPNPEEQEDKADLAQLAQCHQPDLRLSCLASPASSLEGGNGAHQATGDTPSVHLLETEAPQRNNPMGQSGPRPRFGKPDVTLQ